MQLGTTRRARRMGRQASNRAYITSMEGRLKAQGRQRERAFRAEPWCKQDLFFMENTLRRGASFGEVAGFLCRPEGEVRAKAIELGIHAAEEPWASRTERPSARSAAVRPCNLAVRPRSGADRTAEKGDACDSLSGHPKILASTDQSNFPENWCYLDKSGPGPG